MSYQDAIRDNIRISGEMGESYYYPPCSQCGVEVKSWAYNPRFKYTCKECRESNLSMLAEQKKEKERIKAEEARKRKRERSEDTAKKNINMMSRALERISKITDLAKYAKPIEKVQADMDKGEAFDSTEELLVALELTRQGVKYRQQVRFGPYRADFVLDSYKIVMEIDGSAFHTKDTRPREELRDNLILASLGPEWEVLRIKDDVINLRITQLTKAIMKVLQHRKLIRRAHNGVLPAWYSGIKT
jgi:very-short-patch-repair endonuclease/endogenous inhibitor of DNA gyrase (YacG/DUF329 family)